VDPALQQEVTALETALTAALEVAEGKIPWVAIGNFIFEEIMHAIGVPTPMEALMGAFVGRPTLAATVSEAQVFRQYSSPVAKTLAMGATQLLNANIPISSPDAGPIFGRFFVAAQHIENAIRFGDETPAHVNLTNETLSAAMHEAGNYPGAGTATLQTLQDVWTRLIAGQPTPGPSAYTAIKALADNQEGDPAHWISKAWAQAYINRFPYQFPTTPPPKPPPPPPTRGTPGMLPAAYRQQLGQIVQNEPPGRPIYYLGQNTGDYAAPWYQPTPANLASTFPGLTLGQLVTKTPTPSTPATITFNQPFDQTVKGIITLQVTLEGGPYPSAHAEFRLGGKVIGDQPAETTTPTEKITVRQDLDTRHYPDGAWTITVLWIGHLGTVHDSQSTVINIENASPPPPPPPPPPPKTCPPGFAWNPQTEQCEPLPPPPIPLPWDIWFDVCREKPDCTALSNDAAALVQSIANVALAVGQFIPSLRQETVDPCCQAVVSAITAINHQLAALTKDIAGKKDVNAIAPVLWSIANSLGGIRTAAGNENNHLVQIAEALDRLNVEIKECCKAGPAIELDKLLHEFQMLNHNLDVPKPIIDQLVTLGIMPDEMGQLATGSPLATAEAALSSWWHRINHPPTKKELEAAEADPMIGPVIKTTLAGKKIPPFKEILKGAPAEIAGILAGGAETYFEKTFPIAKGFFGPIIREMIKAHEDTLKKFASTAPGNEITEATNLIVEAAQFGVAAHWAAVVAEIFVPSKHLGINQMAAMLSTLSGFEEIMGAFLKPEFAAAISRPHGYAMNREFPNALPPPEVVWEWFSRRLYSEAKADHITQSYGYSAEFAHAMRDSSYRPIQPRALTSLFEDQEFPRDLVESMLDYAGIRDHDKHTLLDAYEWNSTKNVRHQYLSAVLAAGEAGVLDHDTVDSHLDSIHFSKQAKNYVHTTIAIKRLQELAKLYQRSVTILYETGQLSDSQYIPALEAVGLDRAQAEAQYAVDSARLKGKVLAEEERLQTRLDEQAQREQIAAIRLAYLQATNGRP